MKKIVTCLIMVLISISVMYAEIIPLKPKDPPGVGDGKKLNRETILAPSASVENRVINIETALASWGVAITIYNSDGAVVYTSVSADESKQHSFAIETLSADYYTLEVQIGDDYYEGDFTIN